MRNILKMILAVFPIVFVLILQFTPSVDCAVPDLPSDRSNLYLRIALDDIDSRRQMASFIVQCSANLYAEPPYSISDVIGVNLDFFRGSWPYYSVQVIARNQGGAFYQGTKTFEVPLDGSPMLYPYDSYAFNISFWIPITIVPLSKVNLNLPVPYVLSGRLTSAWKSAHGPIPSLRLTKEGYVAGGPFSVVFQRTETVMYKVVLPLYSIFVLLGATILLDPKKHAGERFTVYLSGFVYVLSFRPAVAEEMPMFVTTIGELLVHSLVICNVTMAFFTILYLYSGRFQALLRFQTLLDPAAVLLSLFWTACVSRIWRGDDVVYSISNLPPDAIVKIVGGLLFGLILWFIGIACKGRHPDEQFTSSRPSQPSNR